MMTIFDRNEEANLMEEANFSEQYNKTPVRDDYIRMFSQLIVSKYLSCMFLHSNL